MDDADVEMEFISVMGVLVPMEVTKGVSADAKRFAGGGLSSGEEAPESEEVDTDTNHGASNSSEHTEDTCVHSECSDSGETEDKYSDQNEAQKRKHPNCTKVAATQGKYVDHSDARLENEDNDVVAAVEGNSSSVTGVGSNRKEVEMKASGTLASQKASLKTENRSGVRKRKRKKHRRKEQQENTSNKRQEKLLHVEVKERRSDGSSVTEAKRSKRESMENVDETLKSTSKVLKQSSMSPSKKMTGAAKNERNIASEKETLGETIMPINEETATVSSTSVTAGLPPVVASGPKRRVKRHRIGQGEVTTKLKQHKVVASTDECKIQNTWKLDSDDEAHGTQDGKARLKPMKLQKTALAVNNISNSRVETIKTGSSSRCAYPECTQSARYKSRCLEHCQRARCSLPGCSKFAHSGGKCISHGGGARCTEDGCQARARSMGKCYAHGGGIKCSHPECTTRAKTKGKCIAHGGGTLCSETGCSKLVVSGGKCIAHGGKIKCSYPGCGKRVHIHVRRKCIDHSKSRAETEVTNNSKRPEKTTALTTEFDSTTNENDENNPRSSLENCIAVKAESPQSKRCTAKSSGVRRKRGQSSERIGDTAGESKSAPESKAVVKRRRKQLSPESARAEQEAMSLRSGQRLTRVSNSRYGVRSEEDALQMALKLSEIEY
ncbi:unnamed protein product [Phytophthora fragariaefolia]|uniref:Unnamed protein product n=1 Tax=Phytophthora fragariaefolia TaxID=1490495 RepID=A0A9W7CPM0_9STRA|nr:unnamed protein product [Phytophthora fragariaefolia]